MSDQPTLQEVIALNRTLQELIASKTTPPLPSATELAQIAAPLAAPHMRDPHSEYTADEAYWLRRAFALWQSAQRFLDAERAKAQAHSNDHDE